MCQSHLSLLPSFLELTALWGTWAAMSSYQQPGYFKIMSTKQQQHKLSPDSAGVRDTTTITFTQVHKHPQQVLICKS